MPAYHLFSIFVFIAIGCSSQKEKALTGEAEINVAQPPTSYQIIDPEGQTLMERINPPQGFTRITLPDSSFGTFLRQLELKEHGAEVLLYDGSGKNRQDVHIAVIKIDVGERDLQQCADAIMRLRGEYLYQTGQYDRIRFHFTNGFLAEYNKWRQGYRIEVNGNNVTWIKKTGTSAHYASFRSYLETVFAYAGTLSLERETQSIPVEKAQTGDFFIKGGSPGHAVIIIDVCENFTTGEKMMLLAQSYMPAQEIHVLKNPRKEDDNPWYDLNFGDVLTTPEWTFEKTTLHRFR